MNEDRTVEVVNVSQVVVLLAGKYLEPGEMARVHRAFVQQVEAAAPGVLKILDEAREEVIQSVSEAREEVIQSISEASEQVVATVENALMELASEVSNPEVEAPTPPTRRKSGQSA